MRREKNPRSVIVCANSNCQHRHSCLGEASPEQSTKPWLRVPVRQEKRFLFLYHAISSGTAWYPEHCLKYGISKKTDWFIYSLELKPLETILPPPLHQSLSLSLLPYRVLSLLPFHWFYSSCFSDIIFNLKGSEPSVEQAALTPSWACALQAGCSAASLLPLWSSSEPCQSLSFVSSVLPPPR